MRDYSFGNFISALRERCGLSQYQLGALVGVSDKAVSKWENGASKPRTDTIRKLAEVLHVSIDELLTCEYDTFKYERKDLFAMKNNIIELAYSKMKLLYGENPPVKIVNRFQTEKMMLEGHEVLLWMGFLGKLREEASANHLYFEVRGAQIGSSLIAWLLGATNINPFPVHYYCPKCKKVEFSSGAKCGIDLPDGICTCGNPFLKDGFNIDAVNMYPLSKNVEIRVSGNSVELIKKCMQEYFAKYGDIVELHIICENGTGYQETEQIRIVKLALLSRERAKEYPGKVMTMAMDEYAKTLEELSILTIIEDNKEQLEFSDFDKTEFTSELISNYYEYAKENGKFEAIAGNTDLSRLLATVNNPNFSDLLAIMGMQHGTGVWENNAELLYGEGKSLQELISCREDVYEYLYKSLSNVYGDNPMGQAFEMKEQVRKGLYSRKEMPEEVEKLLKECDIPDWYIESLKKIKYLFPKTHLIMLLKRDMCKYAVGK